MKGMEATTNQNQLKCECKTRSANTMAAEVAAPSPPRWDHARGRMTVESAARESVEDERE